MTRGSETEGVSESPRSVAAAKQRVSPVWSWAGIATGSWAHLGLLLFATLLACGCGRLGYTLHGGDSDDARDGGLVQPGLPTEPVPAAGDSGSAGDRAPGDGGMLPVAGQGSEAPLDAGDEMPGADASQPNSGDPADAGAPPPDTPDSGADAGEPLPPPPTSALQFAAGQGHTCAVEDGRPVCWGDNGSYALGEFEGEWSSLPVRITGEASQGGFVQAAVGERYACVRRDDGSLWCWGRNDHGQLGTGDTDFRSTPHAVELPDTVAYVATRFSFSCALLTNAQLWCWGENEEGQLAQGEWPPMSGLTPMQVPSTEPWAAVSAGQGHACGIRQDGTLWCWGRNGRGELGQGAESPGQIRSPVLVGEVDDEWSWVSAGQLQTCGIRNGGELYCWGENESAQLGVGDRDDRDVPARVGAATDWLQVSVNTLHACGIRAPGSLWCWGRNVEGQLGLGDTDDRLEPAQVQPDSDWSHVSSGRFHTCAMRVDGTIWCMGANAEGQLGTGDVERRYVPTAVTPFPP